MFSGCAVDGSRSPLSPHNGGRDTMKNPRTPLTADEDVADRESVNSELAKHPHPNQTPDVRLEHTDVVAVG